MFVVCWPRERDDLFIIIYSLLWLHLNSVYSLFFCFIQYILFRDTQGWEMKQWLVITTLKKRFITGGGRLSVSALCHGVINIQFSSGAASLHTLTLLQVAVFERFLHKSAEWIWSSHNSSMLQLACKQESCLWYACECTGCLPGADLWCLFVCVYVCVCVLTYIKHLCIMYIKPFLHTLCMCVNVCLAASVPMRGLVCVLNITAANP